ncbi:MAG TPA: amidohydrolase family protein [Chloroflexota bacterium]|jgi:predicted TIM-barrel fold metal-dependent hydrolase|nr:amidohydrolase family protein [Chloroflexota bacterium]
MSAPTTASATQGILSPDEVIISADSHVMEPHDLWEKRLPASLRDQAPRYPPHKVGEGFQARPGGTDPSKRLEEMAQDGLSAEVLYPTLGLGQFGMDDARLQEACFRVYNDWLIEYCQVAPDRLIGLPNIACYDIDWAVKELERCVNAGLRGLTIWQHPHPDLPFYSDHYHKLWDAAQALDQPISLHILTGHNYSKTLDQWTGVARYHKSVNMKLQSVTDVVFDLIFYGVCDRYPRLKFILVEFEIGWMPFYFQQWGYYWRRFRKVDPPPNQRDPREYLGTQFFATFFNDPVGAHYLDVDPTPYMWSNDYPHPNSTWPHSRQVIERDLGRLPAEARRQVICENVARLYNIRIPEPLRL